MTAGEFFPAKCSFSVKNATNHRGFKLYLAFLKVLPSATFCYFLLLSATKCYNLR